MMTAFLHLFINTKLRLYLLTITLPSKSSFTVCAMNVKKIADDQQMSEGDIEAT